MAKKKTNVIDWLRDNPIFSLSAVERRADIPSGYLSKEIKGVKILQPQHIERLEKLLAAYGFK